MTHLESFFELQKVLYCLSRCSPVYMFSLDGSISAIDWHETHAQVTTYCSAIQNETSLLLNNSSTVAKGFSEKKRVIIN